MHYHDDELYFYLKNEEPPAKKAEIEKHLQSCPACGEAYKRISAISHAFKSTLAEPPLFNPRLKSAAAAKPAAKFSFKPVFAGAFALVIVFSAVIIINVKNSSANKEQVSSFVYNTYNTLYDYDYYKENYVDKTNILSLGGVK